MKTKTESFSLAATRVALKYIIESPAREHGGFHEEAVLTAVSALDHINQLEEKLFIARSALKMIHLATFDETFELPPGHSSDLMELILGEPK